MEKWEPNYQDQKKVGEDLQVFLWTKLNWGHPGIHATVSKQTNKKLNLKVGRVSRYTLLKKNIQIANMHMEICPTHKLLEKWKSKPLFVHQDGYNHKAKRTRRVGESRMPSIASGNVNDAAILQNLSFLSQTVTMWHSNTEEIKIILTKTCSQTFTADFS